MFSGKAALIPPIFVIVVTLGVGGYFLYDAYLTAQEANARIAAEEAKIGEKMIELRTALAGVAGLSALEIEDGFWYEYRDQYGNRTLLYFDLYSAAREDLTAAQIQSLKSHVASSSVLRGTVLAEVPAVSLPPILMFHNDLYSSAVTGTSTIDLERSLEAVHSAGKASSDDLLKLSYLAELGGNYSLRDTLNAENCTRFESRCDDSLRVVVRGRVVDSHGAPIEGASVSVLSRPSVKAARSDGKGVFLLETGAKEMEKLRIRAFKRNFSDGYADLVLVQGATARTYDIGDIRIESPVGILTINYAARTVTGMGNTFNSDRSVTLQTSQSTYRIPADAIVHEDGRPYTGNTVDVYLYEFTKGDPPPNLIEVDTFDQVRGYAGDLMKSFGMPYIQFFADDGEELHVRSSKPMVLTYKIPDMDALYQNTDRIYEALTPADMQLLVDSSKGKEYPIDREFLIGHQLLRFPAFWVFDRKRGVWDNVGINVLDVQGTIRTVFYTQRDS